MKGEISSGRLSSCSDSSRSYIGCSIQRNIRGIIGSFEAPILSKIISIRLIRFDTFCLANSRHLSSPTRSLWFVNLNWVGSIEVKFGQEISVDVCCFFPPLPVFALRVRIGNIHLYVTVITCVSGFAITNVRCWNTDLCGVTCCTITAYGAVEV
jgi:hypothetical protein